MSGKPLVLQLCIQTQLTCCVILDQCDNFVDVFHHYKCHLLELCVFTSQHVLWKSNLRLCIVDDCVIFTFTLEHSSK